jgi:hypothetical protein
VKVGARQCCVGDYSVAGQIPGVSIVVERRMNVFDTEHPLNLLRPRADSRMRRWFLHMRFVLTVALIVFPFLAIFLWCVDASSEVETTGDEIPPFWALVPGLGIASLTLSIIVTSLYTFVSWIFRRLEK